jgi:hypothetical protein
MSGDAHVRICESLGVKSPRATRLYLKIDGRMAYLRCIAASMSPVAVPFRAGRKSRPEPSNNLQAAATSQPVHQDNVSEPLTPGEASGRI